MWRRGNRWRMFLGTAKEIGKNVGRICFLYHELKFSEVQLHSQEKNLTFFNSLLLQMTFIGKWSVSSNHSGNIHNMKFSVQVKQIYICAFSIEVFWWLLSDLFWKYFFTFSQFRLGKKWIQQAPKKEKREKILAHKNDKMALDKKIFVSFAHLDKSSSWNPKSFSQSQKKISKKLRFTVKTSTKIIA